MLEENLQKISIRIEQELLNRVDETVDYLWIKNRSDAIRFLVRKALGKERICVILSKGSDLPNQKLNEELIIDSGELAPISVLPNGKTLLEEQIELLEFLNFTKIYIISTKGVIEYVEKKYGNREDIIPIENEKHLQSMDALRLLKGKVESDFMVLFANRYPSINIQNLFEIHSKNNHYVTMNLTWTDKQTVSYVKVDGTSVTEFIEKHSRKPNLTFNSIFVAHPKIFDETGSSLTHDVFPKISKEGLVEGFITGNRVPHIKNKEDKTILFTAINKYKKNFFKVVA